MIISADILSNGLTCLKQSMARTFSFTDAIELIPENQQEILRLTESNAHSIVFQELQKQMDSQTPNWGLLERVFQFIIAMKNKIYCTFSDEERKLIWDAVFRCVFQCNDIKCSCKACDVFCNVFVKKEEFFHIDIPMEQLVDFYLRAFCIPSVFPVGKDIKPVLSEISTNSFQERIVPFYKNLKKAITEEQYQELLSIILPTFPISNTTYGKKALQLLINFYPEDFFNLDFTRQIMNEFSTGCSSYTQVYIFLLLPMIMNDKKREFPWEDYLPMIFQTLLTVLVDPNIKSSAWKTLGQLLVVLMTVGKKENGLYKGIHYVLKHLRVYLPFIQPGNTVGDNTNDTGISTLISYVFISFHKTIYKELKAWKKGDKDDIVYYFINTENVNEIFNTPMMNACLSFFLDYFYCTILSSYTSSELYIKYLVEFCPTQVFQLLIDGLVEIQNDDKNEENFGRLFQLTSGVLNIYSQMLEEKEYRFFYSIPKEGEKEEKLVELVDSYLSAITMTLQTSGSVENRIACLTILQTLFSQPSLYPYISILSCQDQYDIWIRELYPAIVKASLLTDSLPKSYHSIRFIQAIKNILSFTSIDTTKSILFECIEILQNRLGSTYVFELVEDLFHFFPITPAIEKRIIYQVEEYFNSLTAMIPTEYLNSTSLSFASIDFIHNKEQVTHDFATMTILLSLLPTSYHHSFFQKYQQLFILLFTSPSSDIRLEMQLIIMHACVKTSDIKQPFELLPSVFATSSQYKEYFNQFYSYRYPFDDIYLLFYQPMYDYITANYQTIPISLLAYLFSSLVSLNACYCHTAAICNTGNSYASIYITPSILQSFEQHSINSLYPYLISRLCDDDGMANCQMISLMMKELPNLYNYRKIEKLANKQSGIASEVLSRRVAIALQKDHIQLENYTISYIIDFISKMENELSLLFFSKGILDNELNQQQWKCIQDLFQVVSFNNRTIQNTVIQLYQKSLPIPILKQLTLYILQNLHSLLQKDTLTSTESYTVCCLIAILNLIVTISSHIALEDQEIVQLLIDCIALTEKAESLINKNDIQQFTSHCTSLLSTLSSEEYLCYIQYTPSLIQSITQYFFSISSWVKKSFYLTYLTEAIIRSSYPIPQEDTIMQSILLSFNSILYRIAIRFFALKPRLFCNQLLLLSQEQQVQVLQFFIQNSYTVLEDVCKSGSPLASSDVYSSDICSMLCNCVRFVSSIKLLDISSVSESIQNIGRYHILLFHEMIQTCPDWISILLTEAIQLSKTADKEKEKSNKIMISSLFSILLIDINLIEPSVNQELFIQLITQVSSSKQQWLTSCLLYTLLTQTQPEDFPRLFNNLNMTAKILLEYPNDILYSFLTSILLYIYIHDHSRIIYPQFSIITSSIDHIQLIHLLDTSSIVHCIQQTDTIINALTKINLLHLLLLTSEDPQAYLSLYQEKQQHLKEEDGSLNQIAVVDYLASMVSLSTIRPTLLIQYFTQDQIDQIMKSYYFHLIEFSTSIQPVIMKAAKNYLFTMSKKSRFYISTIHQICQEMGSFIQSVQSIQTLSSNINLLSFTYHSYYFILQEDVRNEVMKMIMNYLTYPNITIRMQIQDCLVNMFLYLSTKEKQKYFDECKKIIEKEDEDLLKKEAALRVCCALMLDINFVLKPFVKEVILYLCHYETSEESLMKIISEAFSQFRKMHTKRLDFLKKEFEPDDWDIINSNSTYVSYFLYICFLNNKQ